jgi:hypothetical protein
MARYCRPADQLDEASNVLALQQFRLLSNGSSVGFVVLEQNGKDHAATAEFANILNAV